MDNKVFFYLLSLEFIGNRYRFIGFPIRLLIIMRIVHVLVYVCACVCGVRACVRACVHACVNYITKTAIYM